ncbi:hypothetical protein MVES1_000947 [Malassezia vespertilionis]|uniref:Sec39 domain-containing protein n=1 Tax=Malassezia vespertilionis TaxID=2020962 RepID=A0A2N1JFB6_9BASI|nr:uncharacterized protein MVES1_000947 [Malassezia vespertilionis]PKI85247.1 hypothetical protein MVES_000893 [Malassezia vespertilionis]WFD05617.1 hypothetical protein MVES1_000947 [Malassezia vespertilionis]
MARVVERANDAHTPMDGACERRALLSALPAPPEHVEAMLHAIDDPWWVAAATLAAVRAARTTWKARDAVRILSHVAERTAAFDDEIKDVLRKDATVRGVDAWLAAEPTRLPRTLLRRQLWLMQWLLCIPIAREKSAYIDADMASLAGTPLLTHAQNLCLAGNARALRALLGAHVCVARALFPHRFSLLHALLTAGGVWAHELAALRLLPGTRMPVEDCESGAWMDGIAVGATSRMGGAASWVEHPAVVEALSVKGLAAMPPPPPPPPSALSAWYAAVISELESTWGLVDRALSLAHAGVRLSLVSLKGAASELQFLDMLVYGTPSTTRWSIDRLHGAHAQDIMVVIAKQPMAAAHVVGVLREAVAPFLRTGTYADPVQFHNEPDIAIPMLLALLDSAPAVSFSRVLEILAAALETDWVASADARARLALAVLGACPAADAASYEAMHAVGRAVAADAESDTLAAVLEHILEHDAPGVRALWTDLAPASDAAIRKTLAMAARLVALGRALLAHGFARAPRYYAGMSDSRSEHLCAALVESARGEAWRLERILLDLAPYIGVEAPAPLPRTFVAFFFRALYAAQAFNTAQQLAQSLPQFAPRLAPCFTSADAESLLLHMAETAMAEAPAIDLSHATLVRAAACLSAAPPTPPVARLRNRLTVLGQLAKYRLPCMHEPKKPLTPAELDAMPDKLVIFARLLALHSGAYRAPHIHDLGRALAFWCAEPKPSEKLVRVRIGAMLAEAAAAAGDMRAAQGHCDVLAKQGRGRDEDGSLREARDIAWRTCLQLAKHPAWEDARPRAMVLGHALALAPPAQLPRVLDVAHTVAPGVAPGVPSQNTPAFSRLLARPRSPPSRAAQLLDGVGSGPSTPHAGDAASRARSLFDTLGSPPQGSPHQAPLLPSTAALRDAVETTVSRGMGWWMGGDARR